MTFGPLKATLRLMWLLVKMSLTSLQDTYRDVFFHCSKQFLNLSILMPSSASAVFCFPSYKWTKSFPLRTFFPVGRQKKNSHSGWDCDWRGQGTGVIYAVLVKNCRTLSTVWAGVLINHPSWNRQTHWKSLQKNSLKLHAPSLNTSWCSDTDGFLEHSPSRRSLYCKGPALQKVIPVLFCLFVCFEPSLIK